MQPSRQKRQWQAQWQSQPRSSTDHSETRRRFHGSNLRHENQDHDPWPPRSTSQLRPRRHANSAAAPSWRDRVSQRESRAQGGNRWIPSEAEEHSQRRQPPVRRWRSPEPQLRWRRSELDSSSVSRSWAQRHQDPHPLRAPRSLNVSRLGRRHTPDPVVDQQWESDLARDGRSTQLQWVPNDGCKDDDDDDDDDDLEKDDDEAEEEEEEDSDEQSNFTLKHRYSPPTLSYERRQSVRADNQLQRTHDRTRLSHDAHVGVLHNQVPSWAAHRRLSRRVEMPARRWSQSRNRFQDSQSETDHERATPSLTTNSVDVQSYPMRPTKREMVRSMVRQPPHAFEAGQAQSLVDRHDERVDNGNDNRSDWNAHSTGKRTSSPRGKRKPTLTHDVAVVDCANEPGEELVAIKPVVSGSASGIVKPQGHRTRKGYRKECQYLDGCDKGAIGRTLLCQAHGGGKRCQYPEGCDKGAEGSTMFCKAHGGGRRCQYPEGCLKSAEGSTLFCIAHGGGKRCQYPDGCDKSAEGSTMFCIAHGGGKRCQYPDGCGKCAQGSTMFCIAHGGGKRCRYPDGCDKSARGSTLFCAAHGGGKRCQYPEGCGKSAVGRTLFCTAHGGGKRCQYPEGCSKGAEGSTMFCAAHGGGKRCQYPEGCGKSAIGRTLFCRSHGGGKRCQYPEGCGKGAQGSTMFCLAHGGGRRCGHDSGCRKHARRGGLCKSHGADAGV
jgi:hypothetical protein